MKQTLKAAITAGFFLAALAAHAATPQPQKGSMRVLYVEDDSAHVELARRTLESGQFDCTLDSVETIQGALSRLEADPQYDVVLTDLLLPDGNGLDLIRLIRGRKSPPAVVLVTGQGNQDSAVAALKAGAADYIVKQSDYLHRLPVAVHNAFAQNILAREHAALDEAQARYRALFEQSHDAVFILDLQGKYIDVNRRATDMLGYAKEEIQRLSLADLSVEPEKNQQIVTRLLRGKSFPPFEGKVRRKKGEIITTEITLELVRDGSGQPLHIQSVVRDITQRKKTEEALRASEERYRLIFEDNPLPMWVCDLETLVTHAGTVKTLSRSPQLALDFGNLSHVRFRERVIGPVAEVANQANFLQEAAYPLFG